MNKKLMLIDGHSILNRAFYGIPNLTNSEGLHTNAVYGFLNIMFRFLDEENPDYLMVAFDVHQPTFRHEMYDGYKATRHKMPEELVEQVPMIQEVLKAMDIKVVTLPGYEADDILGTLSKQGEEAGIDVTVISGDRDLLQLASDQVKIRIPKTKGGKTEVEDYNRKDVIEKYQVTPEEFIEVKALMGDSSDNIIGVSGIGEKTAIKIINQYHSIENAYEHVSEIKPPRASKNLEAEIEVARFAKKLVTICRTAPVSVTIEEGSRKDFYTKEAYELFVKLEFKNFLTRFDNLSLSNQCEESFTMIGDFNQAIGLFDQMKKQEEAALVILQENKKFFGLSLSLSEKENYYIPAGGFINEDLINNYIKDYTGTLYTLHLKEEYEFFEGLSKIQVKDLGLAAYLLNPISDQFDSDYLANKYLGLNVPSYQDLFKKKSLKEVLETEPDTFKIYACYQSYVCFQAGNKILNKLEELGMKELYEEVELPLTYVLYDMTKTGVIVKKDALSDYSKVLQEELSELQNQIYQEAGEEFNINSPKQLGIVLFEKTGIEGGKKTKTGYSTSADLLEKLAPSAPIIKLILQYRKLAKLKSTYADALPSYIKEDGRIHGKFHQMVTATGRISSSDPNLQNIPIRMEMGKVFRKVFVPREGALFVDADYSQIELRILAHMSGDENLISAFNNHEDIHTMTASHVFHVPVEEVTPELRRNAKAVNFGIVYGISAFGLGEDLNISRKEAESYIKEYFAMFPKVKEFLDQCVEQAKKDGAIETIFHRIRPIPELSSSNYMEREFGKRIAMNSPVQGTAADIMKIAMVKVAKRLEKENLKSKIVLQVHDELLVEAPMDEVDVVKKILEEEMSGAANLAVKLEVEVLTGKNWLEAHE